MQPQTYYFPVGQEFPAPAYFSILASGENLSYQWQFFAVEGRWVNSTAASGRTMNYTPSITEGSFGRTQYRCIVSSSEGEVVSQAVSAVVSTDLLSVQNVISWIDSVATSIFSWASDVCTCIVQQPLLLFTVGFLALGGSIAIVSRLLSRS